MRLPTWRLARLCPPTNQRLLGGRVEDWRACDGRSLCALLSRCSFASVTHYLRPCHVSSPRRVERSVRISRSTLSCRFHPKAYVTYLAGTAVVRAAEPCSR